MKGIEDIQKKNIKTKQGKKKYLHIMKATL